MAALDAKLIKQAAAGKLERGPSAKTETGDREPDEGTVIGWRAWSVPRTVPEDGQVLLNSVSFAYFWVPFEKARASCDQCTSTDPTDRNCTPGERCTCGFYTANSLAHLRTMGYHAYNSERDGNVTVVGRVANWGKVIPGSQGWRAEYAYPTTLYVPFEAFRLAKPLMDTYGVEAKLLNLLDPDARPKKARKMRDFQVVQSREPKFLADYRKRHGIDDGEDE